MQAIHRLVHELIEDENGNSVTEYAMIIAVTVVFVMFGVSNIEHPIDQFFAEAGDLFDELVAESSSSSS